MMKLAGKSLETRRPADLDQQLIAATGCGASEIDTILGAGPDRAAAALRPFLKDKAAFPGHDLARAIASDPEALAGIRSLFGAPDEEEAAVDDKAGAPAGGSK